MFYGFHGENCWNTVRARIVNDWTWYIQTYVMYWGGLEFLTRTPEEKHDPLEIFHGGAMELMTRLWHRIVAAVDLGRSWFHHRKNLALALRACEWRQAEHEVVLEQWMRSAESGVCWLRRYATHFKNRNWQHGNIISEDIRWYCSVGIISEFTSTLQIMLVGGIPTPLKNDGVKVNGKDDIPFLVWKIIHSCLKPPSSMCTSICESVQCSSRWAHQNRNPFSVLNHLSWGSIDRQSHMNTGVPKHNKP